MKRFYFLVITFFASYLFSAVSPYKFTTIEGKILKIDENNNFFKINSKKVFYSEKFEKNLKKFLNKKVKVKVKKVKNRLILIKLTPCSFHKFPEKRMRRKRF